jgi:hypothetical protein
VPDAMLKLSWKSSEEVEFRQGWWVDLQLNDGPREADFGEVDEFELASDTWGHAACQPFMMLLVENNQSLLGGLCLLLDAGCIRRRRDGL